MIGASTLCAMNRKLESILKLIEESEFERWEVMDEGEHVLTEERIKKLREIGKEYSVHARFADLNLAAVMQDIGSFFEELVKSSLEKAYKLEADLIVIHPGVYSGLGYFHPERAWRNSVDRVKSIADLAQDLGIRVAVENQAFSPILGDVKAMKKFLEEVHLEWVGICFDTGHFFIVNRDAFNLDEISDRILEFHMSDNLGKEDDHLPPGKGSIRWDALIDEISRLEISAPWILEVGRCDDLEEGSRFLEELLKRRDDDRGGS